MAALAGELWKHALPDHDIFNKIRENVNLEDQVISNKFSNNLTFCLDRDFFIWNNVDSVFYTTNLGELNSEEGLNSTKFQTLMCVSPPQFEVHEVLLSPTRSQVALIGQRGATVLELPQRWGKKSEFEGGRVEIHCNSIVVAESLFAGSVSLSLRQAAWYPGEPEEPHLVLLTSDNTIRCYSLKQPESPAKVLCVSQTEDDSWTHTRGRSYAASLGEIAVAFDFGPLADSTELLSSQHVTREVLVYPLYILYENGETYLSYISLSYSGGNLGKILGPLPMYPPAEDNYGHDACTLLCLPCSPSILVIATETGMFYHCVVLEAEDKEDGGVVAKSSRAAETVPSLYVFECIELELNLTSGPVEDKEVVESDFTCPFRLYSDPLCQQRYHCTHEAGVHSVGLTWVNKLHKFLESREENKDSLQELAAEQRGVVEHILCTKPLNSSPPAAIKGFWILSYLSLDACMICITSTYQCLLLPLLSAIRPASPALLCSVSESGPRGSPLRGLAEDSFEQHIRNILARSAAKPLALRAGGKDEALPAQEYLQLLSRATQVFREEYILKQDMAREEMQRRMKLLTAQKNKQLEDLALCREERRSLRETAERLADKYEDAKYRQEALINRVKCIMGSQRSQLPVLSNSEKDMIKELQNVNNQLHHLSNGAKEVKMKMEYQKKQMDKGVSQATSSVILNAQQRKHVQGILKEQGGQISDMMKQIKDLKNHFGF
ncbi:hypothetical protein AALO_G00021370 [Alosa alosa]|uniref:Nucleoporin 88 n=1 Tax=Alosa alosa TaxID=278164 RepID=A0AAV6H993_9TELE|nr:nucleoporin 88 isoform X1 [Alosa alosa]KAG5283954.1 hypothetical protein AALO_G00021370 [Alosa alosa]